jgi:hypothetical protein
LSLFMSGYWFRPSTSAVSINLFRFCVFTTLMFVFVIRLIISGST